MKRLLLLPPHGRALCALAALALFALAPPSAALDPLDPFETAVYDAIHDVEAESAPKSSQPVSASDLLVDGYPLLSPEEGSLERTGREITVVRSPPLPPFEAASQALRFLASQQRPDGSWGHDGFHSVAATSWVLLALLYNEGANIADDDWRDMYERAVRFLLDARREDGSFADAGLLPDGRGDGNAPVHALLAAAAATRDPRIAKAAETAARAAFGTNAPPDLFRQLDRLAEHPAFRRAFIDIRRERARSLLPAREISDGRLAGFWNAPPEYGELKQLLPELPDSSLPRWLENDVRTFHGPPVDIVVLATAASLLVPGRMGVVSRIPHSVEAASDETAPATERIDARPLDSDDTRTCAWRWLFAQQAPDGSWPGADPVVDTSLALLAFAAEPSCGSGVAESSDAVSAAVGFLASSIRDDGTFPVRDPEGDAARLPVLALRALAGITPHPGVLSLLRRTGVAPADYRREYFGEELAFRLPAVPSAEWKALADADRRARRWETRTIARRGGDGTDGPCLLLHWDEPPAAPFLTEDSPLPAAAFRPLPADASPEARALRATTRWLLVPVARSTHFWILRHGPAFATNAPAALFPDDVKVTVRRHAEVAEVSLSGGGSGEAEPPPVESHAESAEAAEFGSPAGGAGEQSEPEGVSHAASAEGAFFLAALERAREIAARAGAECHVRTLYSATRGLEFKRGTQFAAQLTVPNPSADEDKTWLSKATVTLYLGLVGTNGVDLADYDDEIRYGEFRKKADANGIVSTGQGTQLCLRPTIRNKCLHWTDGMVYAILQYPVRFEPALFAGLWRETTNAVAGRALSAPPPADIPAARPDDLEEEGVRLLPVLTERFAEAGLERIWACWFVSRAPLYDGSFLRLSSGQGLDNTKNREWWMRMTAHATAPANPERNLAVADLFYGRTDGRPFVLEDYALANRGRTPKIRAWTDGDRFVVLRPYTPRDEDAVWDRFFEITTNVVRGPVFAP